MSDDQTKLDREGPQADAAPEEGATPAGCPVSAAGGKGGRVGAQSDEGPGPAEDSGADVPVVTFHQLYPDAPPPTLADKTLGGTIPLRALKHCEPYTSASGFGWYVYPPIDFSLRWEGEIIYWKHKLEEPWRVLDDPVHLPGFAQHLVESGFEHVLKEGLPPFIGRAFEPGLVQIWSGLVIRTRPGWSLLVRPIANFPRDSRYEVMDGLIETDWFFGPFVTPIRIRKTDEPIRFQTRKPLYQVQPIRSDAYRRNFLEDYTVKQGVEGMSDEDWKAFRGALPDPKAPAVAHGHYKSGVQERHKTARQEAQQDGAQQDQANQESGE